MGGLINELLVAICYISIGALVGSIILYSIYIPLLKRYKTLNNNKKEEKPEEKTYKQGYFNNLIKFSATKDKYIVEITPEGKKKLEIFGTLEEFVSYLCGLVDTYNLNVEHFFQGKRLTNFDEAIAFRWLMVHCMNRLSVILTKDRKDNFEPDSDLYEKAKKLFNEEEAEEEEEIEEDLNNIKTVPGNEGGRNA